MLLQMNSLSSFSLKNHPLERTGKFHANILSGHLGSVERFKSPSTQTNGLVSSKYSIKSCLENFTPECSLSLTKKIKNPKPLKKSTVPLAIQDGYASKSEDHSIVSTSLLDVLRKKLGALYRLTRPYTCVSITIVPAIIMNNFVNAVNQLSDIEIDQVNKPYLPLASGDFSIGEGIAIAIASPLMGIAMGVMLRSPPLVVGFIIWGLVGAAYSIELPLLRWKGSPLMAAVTIVILNGFLLQFPYFIHFQKYVLGRPVVFTKPLLFAAAFMTIFNVVFAFVKDLPDVEDDKESGIRTLPIILGREKVFSIAVNMLLMAYGAAVLVGFSSSLLPCKVVTLIGHSELAAILWRQAQTVDLTDPKSMQSFYMFIFKLYHAEFFLIQFIR